MNLGEHEQIKTLGIQCVSNQDLLTYNISVQNAATITKRSILSI